MRGTTQLISAGAVVCLLTAVSACSSQHGGSEMPYGGPPGMPAAFFPKPDRPVASIVSPEFSDERSRDNVGAPEKLIQLLAIKPGMVIADIGAGSGYYTVRLARRIEPEGKVIAEDIIPEYLQRLQQRVERERLTNVTVVRGEPHDPRLPRVSLDLALLVHMYHEVEQPYALLWNLQPALRSGGRVAIIDANRTTDHHGTPPALLRCELAALGYRELAFHDFAADDGYLAVFAPPDVRPAPESVRACRAP